MPDLAQLALLLAVGAVAAAVIAVPFVRPSPAPASDDERETLELRHRIAIESLRDVEADRRSGSLDEGTYAAQRAEAEQRAAQTLAELEAAPSVAAQPTSGGHRWRPAAIAGVVLAGLLVAGFFVPPPIGLANQVVDTRQQAIQAALDRLQANPRDAEAFSNLADAFLAGDTYADMQRGAAALLALITLEPNNVDAHDKLISTYIRVADWKDASATTDALEKLTPGSPDVPFFRGFIARGEGDGAEAKRQFEAFLEIAPEDPRVPMVRALLDSE
ncbi:MAG TPA: c-type cytochrome biogenesis protein CcmI [Candidatus Limnocylindria bacterium]|nr:c-type cytochrome biogenesis protein CcmI [Candidatus Limnocylindria bacterium]